MYMRYMHVHVCSLSLSLSTLSDHARGRGGRRVAVAAGEDELAVICFAAGPGRAMRLRFLNTRAVEQRIADNVFELRFSCLQQVVIISRL